MSKSYTNELGTCDGLGTAGLSLETEDIEHSDKFSAKQKIRSGLFCSRTHHCAQIDLTRGDSAHEPTVHSEAHAVDVSRGIAIQKHERSCLLLGSGTSIDGLHRRLEHTRFRRRFEVG